jgi:hypothetical protein
MGEVLPFDRGKRALRPSLQFPRSISSVDNGVRKSLKDFTEERIEEILDVIQNTGVHFTPEAITLRHQGLALKHTSAIHICTIILGSDERQWRVSSDYFLALIKEYRSRRLEIIVG